MKTFITCILFLICCNSFAQTADTRYFEMRIYYCNPGKLDALIERFQNHTTRIFEKHGMENIGYWVPTDNTENVLIYVLGFPSREARDKSFKDFGADPDWKAAAKGSGPSGMNGRRNN